MKNEDSIVESIPWIRPFTDVYKMSIHQKIVISFEKMIKAYFKAIILLIETYENILKFKFLIGEGGGKGVYQLFRQVF